MSLEHVELFPPKPMHLRAPGRQAGLPLVVDAITSPLLPPRPASPVHRLPTPSSQALSDPRTCSGHRGLPVGKASARNPGTVPTTPSQTRAGAGGQTAQLPALRTGWKVHLPRALCARRPSPGRRPTVQLARLSLAIAAAQAASLHVSPSVPPAQDPPVPLRGQERSSRAKCIPRNKPPREGFPAGRLGEAQRRPTRASPRGRHPVTGSGEITTIQNTHGTSQPGSVCV